MQPNSSTLTKKYKVARQSNQTRYIQETTWGLGISFKGPCTVICLILPRATCYVAGEKRRRELEAGDAALANGEGFPFFYDQFLCLDDVYLLFVKTPQGLLDFT